MFSIWISQYKEKRILLPTCFHGFFGFFTLLIIIFQSIQGQRKLIDIELKKKEIKTIAIYHGDLGLFLWDLLCFSIFLGLFTLVNIFSFFFYISIFFLFLSWMSLHFQMKKKGPHTSQLQVFNNNLNNLNNNNVNNVILGLPISSENKNEIDPLIDPTEEEFEV